MKRLFFIMLIIIIFISPLFAQQKQPEYKTPAIIVIQYDLPVIILSIDNYLYLVTSGGAVQMMEEKDGKIIPKKLELIKPEL